MGINPRSFIRPTLLWLPVIVLILVVSLANGQTGYGGSAQEEFATVTTASASKAATTRVPVFTDYRGVRIGMTAEEVRSKLDELKKGDGQDFLVFSERESAQIYYDDQGRVTACSAPQK